MKTRVGWRARARAEERKKEDERRERKPSPSPLSLLSVLKFRVSTCHHDVIKVTFSGPPLISQLSSAPLPVVHGVLLGKHSFDHVNPRHKRQMTKKPNSLMWHSRPSTIWLQSSPLLASPTLQSHLLYAFMLDIPVPSISTSFLGSAQMPPLP